MTIPFNRQIPLTFLLFVLLAMMLLCPTEAKTDDESKDKVASPAVSDTKSFYEQLRDVTVEVLVDGRISGMGTFVESDGHIITAGHLFDKPGQQIEILSTAIGRHEVRMVAIDRGHDLALLRVIYDEGEEELSTPVIELAKAMPNSPEQVYQFGAPICRRGVLQTGTVARDGTIFEYLGDQKASVEVTHVCAMVQQGTSGGPWTDREGRLVGVQSATMLVSGSPAGVAFVAPLSDYVLIPHRFFGNSTSGATPHSNDFS